jgi:hypothetical protein
MHRVQEGMPRPASPNGSSVTLRLRETYLERADALVAFLSERAGLGVALTRSDVLRAAIAQGLEVLEAQRDAKSPPKKSRK